MWELKSFLFLASDSEAVSPLTSKKKTVFTTLVYLTDLPASERVWAFFDNIRLYFFQTKNLSKKIKLC